MSKEDLGIVKGFILGNIFIFLILQSSKSLCQQKYNVADCELTFVPDKIAVHTWLWPEQ